MDTENYLQIMIDSLVQKEELLKQIVDYNEKQQLLRRQNLMRMLLNRI